VLNPSCKMAVPHSDCLGACICADSRPDTAAIYLDRANWAVPVPLFGLPTFVHLLLFGLPTVVHLLLCASHSPPPPSAGFCTTWPLPTGKTTKGCRNVGLPSARPEWGSGGHSSRTRAPGREGTGSQRADITLRRVHCHSPSILRNLSDLRNTD
jgi:hypothetical protein